MTRAYDLNRNKEIGMEGNGFRGLNMQTARNVFVHKVGNTEWSTEPVSKDFSVLGRITESEQEYILNVYWQHMDWNKKPFLKSCCSNRA